MHESHWSTTGARTSGFAHAPSKQNCDWNVWGWWFGGVYKRFQHLDFNLIYQESPIQIVVLSLLLNELLLLLIFLLLCVMQSNLEIIFCELAIQVLSLKLLHNLIFCSHQTNGLLVHKKKKKKIFLFQCVSARRLYHAEFRYLEM